MINQLYIINGSAGVGKDSFVRAYSMNTPVVNYSSIALVKKIGALCGIDPNDKCEENRKWWSDMKIFLTRNGDIPFKDVVKKIEWANARPDLVSVFIHIRESYDIRKLKEKYPNVITLLVKNNRVEQITSNAGDADVFNYDYDIEVFNHGSIDDLNIAAEALYKYVEENGSAEPQFFCDNRNR